MRKIQLLLLLMFTIALSSCVSVSQEDAYNFISEFTVDSMVDSYEYDSSTYGIKLSNNSPLYLQTKEDNNAIIINGKEDRVFIYQEEGKRVNSNEVLFTYYYMKETDSLYKLEEDSTSTFIKTLGDLDLYDTLLEKEGIKTEFVSFDSIYPLISTLIKNITADDIDKVAENDLRIISYTVDKAFLVENSNVLRSHLSTIYSIDTVNTIIDSIENSHYSYFHIDLYYDSINKTLLPYFHITYQNFDYYIIESTIDDFYFDLPLTE